MVRVSNIAAAAFSLAIVVSSYAHAAPAAAPEISTAPGDELTLSSAKAAVNQQLAASGQRSLHAGQATFVGQDSVDVGVADSGGLKVGHMIVHSSNSSANAAKSGSKG
jgi:hypothetical protein